MRTMETVLRQEVKQLKELIRQAEKRLKKSPEGQLRAAHKKRRRYFINKEEMLVWINSTEASLCFWYDKNRVFTNFYSLHNRNR